MRAGTVSWFQSSMLFKVVFKMFWQTLESGPYVKLEATVFSAILSGLHLCNTMSTVAHALPDTQCTRSITIP